ncbi:MAG: T9SS type A sorting domain-containing protein [candidate division Zixibacteria bacterium]|nr:T9SS type A sorting domain-containing protein [candidate division Zixibacteria bacterium]
MKTIATILVLFLAIPAISQTADAQLLDSPESIEYDSIFDRYLVSSWDNGNMIQIDSNGVQSVFIANGACYAGLHITGSRIYAAGRNDGIRAYDLFSGMLVLEIDIPEATLLNDITSDTSGNIYVTDPQQNKIFRINPVTESYTIFVENNIYSPNGIYFDEGNNRLLLCSSRSYSPIQAISLEDSSVTTIITNTGLHVLDGFTEDSRGNYYVSSWGTDNVYMYDHEFANAPELISSHSSSPADIHCNKHVDELAVPIFYYDRVEFVDVSSSSVIDNGMNTVPELISFHQNYPNPFNASTTIKFDLEYNTIVDISVYDISGRKIETIFEGIKPKGSHGVRLNAEDYSSGVYFYSITTGNSTESKKMSLIK